MGKKRSRSGSRSPSRESRRKKENKWEKLETRVDNLAKVVEMLVKVQQEQKSPVNSHVDPVSSIVTSGKFHLLLIQCPNILNFPYEC